MDIKELNVSNPLCEQYVKVAIDTGDIAYGFVKGFYNYGEDNEQIVLLCEGDINRIISSQMVNTITILQYEYCTKCGAALYPQDGFEDSGDYWQCKKCGQVLFSPNIDNHSDLFDDTVWICDKCGAVLNQQLGFSEYQGEWKCTECGHENRICEDEIIEDSNGPLS